MFCEDTLGVCVDIGHKKATIGYIGDECPRYSTSSLAGSMVQGGMDIEFDQSAAAPQWYFGEALTSRYEGLKYKQILEKETITNAKQYNCFVDYLLKKTRIEPKETALLHVDQNQNKSELKELLEYVFESQKMPAFFSIKKSIVSLFANGRTSGVVLETGANLTQVVPVSEGYTLYKSIMSTNVGGDTMTNNILNHIEEKIGGSLLPHFCYQYSFDQEGCKKESQLKQNLSIDPSVLAFHKIRLVQELKELHFKVSIPAEESTGEIINYDLPDGSQFNFAQNRFGFAEIFFNEQPRIERGEISVHKMTMEAINKTDIDLRDALLSNIWVVGGNSLLGGFIERYEKSLYQIAPQSARIKVYSPTKNIERVFASWIGGSVLGSTGCFQNMWMSRKEYEEDGPSIFKRKCGGF